MANSRILYLSLVLGLFVLFLSGCAKQADSIRLVAQYPNSKIWAHKANGVWLGRRAESRFKGMEVDLLYSEYQDQLFVGHELDDTLDGLTFEAWLDSLYHPSSNYYWLDMKNLTQGNASRISHHIRLAARRHNIMQHVMVESQDLRALQTVKDSGLRLGQKIASTNRHAAPRCPQWQILHVSPADRLFPNGEYPHLGHSARI